ncbi:MAG: hypothetical protein JRM99_02860 [Nitrososphaerota archaeon]|jgi:hypothetical protein|nr:hypothetical protein [Nitrososphaerota archaeon]
MADGSGTQETEMAQSDDGTDAKVEEVDRLIEGLQKRRLELLRAKEAAGKGRAVPKDAVGAGTPEQEASPLPGLEKGMDALEETLDSLQWKGFRKKDGEWAFLRDREGRLVDELQSSKGFVDRLRKEGEAVVGRYRYRISEDRFLNRYYVGTEAA